MVQEIRIKQVKELLEIFSGFESRNRYQIFMGSEKPTLFAAEIGTAWLSRQFLKNARPFEILISDARQNIYLKIKRPFRFIFHEAEVFDAQGSSLGTIKKRFSLFNKYYDIVSPQESLEIVGPFFRPWTFRLLKEGVNLGSIKKKFSGVFKEFFTDADTFGVSLENPVEGNTLKLLLGAVFLIDFIHFENRRGGGSQ